jgi:hypothetical protein
MPCGCGKNRRFGGTNYIVFLRRVLRFLVTINVLFYPILITLMMEATRSSETSVLILTIATRREIPDDGVLWYNDSSRVRT